MNRKVLFVSQMAYGMFDSECATQPGGAELQMYLIARELATRKGPDVHFLVHDFGQPKRQVLDGMTVWRSKRIFKGVPGLALVRYIGTTITLLTAMAHVGPGVLIQSPAGVATALCALFSRLWKRQFVFWIASDADVSTPLFVYPGESEMFFWGLRNADHVIAQSEWQQRQLLERFGKQSTVIPNAFPIPSEPPQAEKTHILWVASSQRLKQPELFLQLARALPHESFVMIMPKNDPAVFEEIGISAASVPNLRFIPGVPFDQIQRFFDAAKVFVNTSTVEGFPNTFIQAAIGATPVVSLNVDPDGVLTTNGFGECAGGSMESLIEQTRAIASDAPRVREMGTAGFRYAQNTHDIKAVADRLVAITGS